MKLRSKFEGTRSNLMNYELRIYQFFEYMPQWVFFFFFLRRNAPSIKPLWSNIARSLILFTWLIQYKASQETGTWVLSNAFVAKDLVILLQIVLKHSATTEKNNGHVIKKCLTQPLNKFEMAYTTIINSFNVNGFVVTTSIT